MRFVQCTCFSFLSINASNDIADSENFSSIVGAAAVAFKSVCPNRQSEAPADAVATPPLDQLTTQPVTLSYVTVLIHSTKLLELWYDQISILLQR